MQFSPPDRDPMMMLRLSGCFIVAFLFFALCILPVFFLQVAETALENLHLTRPQALLVIVGLLVGSLINLPIARYPTDKEVLVPVFEPVAGWDLFPRYRKLRQEQVVAVNVGGCIVPVLLAIRELRIIAEADPRVPTVLAVGTALNVAVCYWLARPIPNVGIALPAFIPALVALAATWLGLAEDVYQPYRAPVAFVAGISGPLVGADLLHWKQFKQIAAGVVSIGGAGTWDGIVLTGLLAALLA